MLTGKDLFKRMSVLLAIQSHPGANDRVDRNFPYWQRQQPDWVYGLGTTDGLCKWPSGVRRIDCGPDSYLSGPTLPKRMCDELAALLEVPWGTLIFIESDCVIFHRLPVEDMKEGIAAHLAGFQTQGSLAQHFFHSPWCFKREDAIRFVDCGRRVLDEGIAYGSPESSPDVFFGWVCERNGFKVQTDLWEEYSRNSFDHPEHLVEARQAYRDGVDVLHGIKTAEELAYITT